MFSGYSISETPYSSVGVNYIQASILEAASGSDQISSLFVVNSKANEAASGLDTTSSLFVVNSAINETVSGLDAISSTINAGASIYEAASSADLTSAIYLIPRTILESSSVVDSVIATFLWNIIDDTQTNSWALINTANYVNSNVATFWHKQFRHRLGKT
jgi:hypothetical protein